MKNLPIIAVVLVLVAAVGGFVVGMKYQQATSMSAAGSYGTFGQRGSRTGQNGQNAAMRPVSGDILSVDANSMTVKLQDGSSRIVLLTGSTTYSQSTTSAQTNLKVGTRVAAFGTMNSDGSVTAADVQINPVLRSVSSTPGQQPPAQGQQPPAPGQ